MRNVRGSCFVRSPARSRPLIRRGRQRLAFLDQINELASRFFPVGERAHRDAATNGRRRTCTGRHRVGRRARLGEKPVERRGARSQELRSNHGVELQMSVTLEGGDQRRQQRLEPLGPPARSHANRDHTWQSMSIVFSFFSGGDRRYQPRRRSASSPRSGSCPASSRPPRRARASAHTCASTPPPASAPRPARSAGPPPRIPPNSATRSPTSPPCEPAAASRSPDDRRAQARRARAPCVARRFTSRSYRLPHAVVRSAADGSIRYIIRASTP